MGNPTGMTITQHPAHQRARSWTPVVITSPPPPAKPRFLDQVRLAIRARHYSRAKVSASTQHQALAALLFLYRHVIGREVGNLRLRVQDSDASRNEMLVRDGNGAKDRITMLPVSLTIPLQEHLKTVKAMHEQDLADGWGRVQMPRALDRKYPNAPIDWRWQWVAPQEKR